MLSLSDVVPGTFLIEVFWLELCVGIIKDPKGQYVTTWLRQPLYKKKHYGMTLDVVHHEKDCIRSEQIITVIEPLMLTS